MSDRYIFGYAAQSFANGVYFATPATKDVTTGVVTCSNISGMGNTWVMRDGGVFYPESEKGDALQLTFAHCDKLNSKLKVCKP
jgi:hypothetical protein